MIQQSPRRLDKLKIFSQCINNLDGDLDNLKDFFRISTGIIQPKFTALQSSILNKKNTKSEKITQTNVASQIIEECLKKYFFQSNQDLNNQLQIFNQSSSLIGCQGTLAQLLLVQKIEKLKNLNEAQNFLENVKINLNQDINDQSLSLNEVIVSFMSLTQEQGEMSQNRKIEIIIDLFEKCHRNVNLSYGLDIKYIVRALNPSKGLRIGLQSKSMEKCLIDYLKSCGQENSIQFNKILQDFESNIFGYQIQKEQTSANTVKYNVPYKSMIGRSAKTPLEAIEHFQKQNQNEKNQSDSLDLFVEIKYDGERTQLHYFDNQINLFSRNFDNQNQKFSRLLQNLQLNFKKNSIFASQLQKWPSDVKNFILDGEIVYVDENGNFLQFQEMDRKLEDSQKTLEQQTVINDFDSVNKYPKLMVFDILALNDQNLSKMPLKYRKKILAQKLSLKMNHFIDIQGAVKNQESKVIETGFYHRIKNQSKDNSLSEIEHLQKYSQQINCEGLVLKNSLSEYDSSGTRTSQWIKLKNQGLFSESMRDSLDLIPIGAYYGQGLRAGQFGAYLLASFNRDLGVFEAACKVGTGFTKQNLEKFDAIFKDQILTQKPDIYIINKSERLQPDKWLLPNQVWEIGADQITQSPTYNLSITKMKEKFGQDSGGLSLRFPRFLKERADKSLKGDFYIKNEEELKNLNNKITQEYGTDSNEIFRFYIQDLEKKQNSKNKNEEEDLTIIQGE